MMKRIIVPTNFSDTAWNATVHGLEYCRIYQTELVLIHVFEHSKNDLNTNFMEISEAFSKEEEDMKKLLDKIKSEQRYDDICIKSTCIKGSLFEVLTSYLSDKESDLVIMGTNGREGAVGRIFGSNTSRIVKEIQCPILIIPNGFSFSLETPVTCAIDYGSTVNSADLDLLKQMVNAGGNTIFKIVHIIKDKKDSNKPLPLEQFIDLEVNYDEIVGDSIPVLLEKYSQINNSRLLVIVKKEKGFFENIFQGSVSNELAVNANVPLLVLRAKK